MTRPRPRRIVSATVMVLLIAGLPSFARTTPARAQATPARYTVESIGVIDGDDASFAYAINADGAVTGMSVNTAATTNRAILFLDGDLQDLSDGDERSTVGWSINGDGQVAGSVALSAESSGAALWNDEGMNLLPTLGGDSAQTFAVSNDGVAVGGSNTAAGAPFQACFWLDGTPTALVSPAATSFANDVNTRDQIVGAAAVGPDGANHAALWEDGVFTDLGTLGGPTSLARGINGAGQVIGHSTTTPDGQFLQVGTHAFLWEDGIMSDLGTLPGGRVSVAWDISRDGEVVGAAENPATSADPAQFYGAVLWQDGQIVNLNDLIPADSGWVLVSAYGINSAGQIVGVGDLDGDRRGFVLTLVDD